MHPRRHISAPNILYLQQRFVYKWHVPKPNPLDKGYPYLLNKYYEKDNYEDLQYLNFITKQ